MDLALWGSDFVSLPCFGTALRAGTQHQAPPRHQGGGTGCSQPHSSKGTPQELLEKQQSCRNSTAKLPPAAFRPRFQPKTSNLTAKLLGFVSFPGLWRTSPSGRAHQPGIYITSGLTIIEPHKYKYKPHQYNLNLINTNINPTNTNKILPAPFLSCVHAVFIRHLRILGEVLHLLVPEILQMSEDLQGFSGNEFQLSIPKHKARAVGESWICPRAAPHGHPTPRLGCSSSRP